MVRYTLCAFCQHLFGDRTKDACAAYPDGIPAEFISGRAYHLDPAESDQGIQFEPADGQEKSPFVLRVLESHRAMAPEHSSDTPTPAG